MKQIKLEITSRGKSLGSATLDEEQTKSVLAFAAANECDVASLIKRAIYQVTAPEDQLDSLELICPE